MKEHKISTSVNGIRERIKRTNLFFITFLNKDIRGLLTIVLREMRKKIKNQQNVKIGLIKCFPSSRD